MARSIVFVPGKSLKPLPEVHREYLWRALVRGVSRYDAAAADALAGDCRFLLAAWSFAYYGKHGSLDSDIPWIERLMDSEGPSEPDVAEARHWSKWLTRSLYALGDHVHWLIDRLPDPRVKEMIRDTLRYFGNVHGIADRVRGIVKAEIEKARAGSDSVCLIGHSMGSVIAYEALWELTHRDDRPARIELFLTLGSPLGMKYVQHKLLGVRDRSHRYPAGIGKWVNVSAVGDLVSVDERVGDDFAPMVTEGHAGEIVDLHQDIYTAFRNERGLNPHRSYGYLVHPKVGEVIAKWARNE